MTCLLHPILKGNCGFWNHYHKMPVTGKQENQNSNWIQDHLENACMGQEQNSAKQIMLPFI